MQPKWRKKENSDAQVFGGKRVSGSGNKPFKPGDVKTSLFLIEAKTTDKKSFSIPQKMWEKIYNAALMSQRIPILSIKFNSSGTELVVLSKYDFLNLSKNTS